MTPRTNRIVTEMDADFSFQPAAEVGGVPGAMPDGQHFGFASQACGEWKAFRLPGKGLQKRADRVVQPQADPELALLVPVNSFIPVSFRFGGSNDFERHFLARRRFLISAETSSIGVPRPGFFKASSARRSSSAAC